MKPVLVPDGLTLEPLRRSHPRKRFRCGVPAVDDWLATKALQHQDKHLSATKVLVDVSGQLAGFFTLATAQVDFGDLPRDLAKGLPRRPLPVAVLAWLGIDQAYQRRGLGDLLLAQALRDCFEAGRTFSFVAVILDCVDARAKAFYQRWDFQELPGHPRRLFLSAVQLAALMTPA